MDKDIKIIGISLVFFIAIFFLITIVSSQGTYTGTSFSVSTQTGVPEGGIWNGSSFFILGSNKVFEYSASGTYTNFNFSTSNEDSSAKGLAWNGTSFFVVGDTNDKVYEYNATGSYTGFNFSIAGQISYPSDITWNNSKFYVLDSSGHVYVYFGNGTYANNVINVSGSFRSIVANDTNLWYGSFSLNPNTIYGYFYNDTPTGDSFTTSALPITNIRGLIMKNSTSILVVESANDKVWEFTFNDITGPVTTIQDPESKVYNTNTSLNLNQNTADAESSVAYCWYKITNSTSDIIISNTTLSSCGNTTFDVPRSDTYTLIVYSNDTIGNEASTSVTFSIDLTNPAVSINTPTENNNLSSGNNILFNYTVNDDDGIGECYLYSNTTGTWEINESFIFRNWSYTSNSFSVVGQDGISQGATWNGSHFYVVGSQNDRVYAYNSSGSYINVNFSVGSEDTQPNGITWNGTSFFVVGDTNDKVYEYNATGSYTGFNFSVSGQMSNPTDIVWNGTNFYVLGNVNNKVYEYNATGSYTGFNFAADGESLAWDGDFFWQSTFSSSPNTISAIYPNGTSAPYSFTTSALPLTNIRGLGFNDTSLWIVDSSGDKLFEYSLNNSITQTTTKNLTEGYFLHNVKCYDILDNSAYALNNFSLTVDTTIPTIAINRIVVTVGSQTISFNTTQSDSNLRRCYYSIYDSTNAIDGLNNNITYSCSSGVQTSTTATTTDYGTYNLTVYSEDWAGNINSTNQSFTTLAASISSGGSGGGGGTTQTISVVALIKPNITRIFSDLNRAKLYAAISTFCQNNSGTINKCTGNTDKLNILLTDLNDYWEINMTFDELKLWISQYENNNVENVDIDSATAELWGLVSAEVVLVETEFQVTPRNPDRYWLVFNSDILTLTYPSNRILKSCNIESGDVGFECDISQTTAKIKYTLQSKDFTIKTVSVQVSYTSIDGKNAFQDIKLRIIRINSFMVIGLVLVFVVVIFIYRKRLIKFIKKK